MTSVAVSSHSPKPAPQSQSSVRSPRQSSGSTTLRTTAPSASGNSTSSHDQRGDGSSKGRLTPEDMQTQKDNSGKCHPGGITLHRRGGSHLSMSALVNFLFGLLLSAIVVVTAAGIAHLSLPSNHPLQEYVDFVLDHAPRLGLSRTLEVTPFLTQGVEALREAGHIHAAGYLESVVAWPHTEFAFLCGFAVVALLLATIVLRGLWLYKKEREIEVSPPQHMYCANTMTPEQFADRRFTYQALAQLMKDPEFLKLKAQRAVQGSEAWNWQKRQPEQHEEDEEESEDMGSEEEQESN
ncbi:putative transmembrane protein [Toxoplasma gondii TgCatPRC2]|uniref:Transmembrane protein n=3 Tax=Toxoplasma gondii TaxID=5811 RepID=S8F2H8_TOXGM|nr:hypothetical protein TGME49_206320 [Toxoplasma gondii ME49]EPT29931.1 hypothetical protein TGME49_206320 [Toxoplasma gondii ME49]KYK64139.1 putative transmembrane protein [Toxoplasma gondii TgCatPRC2]PIM02346.1 putative transmembrane protein [Toxoplasma gondii COUG]|eukprot:XP_002367813.1 hypothetical protein TGME49_206320 [Toxoplasma gondii ME49]